MSTLAQQIVDRTELEISYLIGASIGVRCDADALELAINEVLAPSFAEFIKKTDENDRLKKENKTLKSVAEKLKTNLHDAYIWFYKWMNDASPADIESPDWESWEDIVKEAEQHKI